MKLHLIIILTLGFNFCVIGQVSQRPRLNPTKPSSKLTPAATPKPYSRPTVIQPIPSPSKITSDKITQCFSENKIDINSKKLEPNYHGNDLILIFDEISRRAHLEKDEFETTKQFNERIEITNKKPLMGNIYYSSNIALVDKGEFKYDADRERMSVSFNIDSRIDWSPSCTESTSYYKSEGYYTLSSEQSRNNQFYNSDYLSFRIPIEIAKRKKTNLRLLFIGSITPTNKKMAELFSANDLSKMLHLKLKDVWVYDISTGEILAKKSESSKDTEESPINPEIQNLINQAKTLFSAGDTENATSLLRKVFVEEPMNAEAYLLLGNIHLRRGELEQAISSLKTALFWNNRLVDAHIALGKIYLEKKDCPQAQNYSMAALEIDANNAEAISLQKSVEQCKRF